MDTCQCDFFSEFLFVLTHFKHNLAKFKWVGKFTIKKSWGGHLMCIKQTFLGGVLDKFQPIVHHRIII
jgi:hypothetical protein